MHITTEEFSKISPSSSHPCNVTVQSHVQQLIQSRLTRHKICFQEGQKTKKSVCSTITIVSGRYKLCKSLLPHPTGLNTKAEANLPLTSAITNKSDGINAGPQKTATGSLPSL